jgi:hypothetical protein
MLNAITILDNKDKAVWTLPSYSVKCQGKKGKKSKGQISKGSFLCLYLSLYLKLYLFV